MWHTDLDLSLSLRHTYYKSILHTLYLENTLKNETGRLISVPTMYLLVKWNKMNFCYFCSWNNEILLCADAGNCKYCVTFYSCGRYKDIYPKTNVENGHHATANSFLKVHYIYKMYKSIITLIRLWSRRLVKV